MRFIFGKGMLVVALALPLGGWAQNVVSGPAPRQDVGRVTLLPGPTLLSPARGAPQATPNITILPASVVAEPGRFRFVPAARNPPAPPHVGARAGTLTLVPSEASPAQVPPSRRSAHAPLPRPETLKFDAKLDAPPSTPLRR